MSTEIEQRVLEMRFDNKQFEQNVSTTMSSLDKLKQGLNLTGAAKGLESVGTAAKGINLSGLSGAAETVSLKFNAMYSAVDQIFRNLVTRAQYTGERIISALTIDPMKTGLQEYETQINAVQTILANTESKGTTLENVNGALDELNTYADKTIYNFTEMTRNIGTFTAAGVDLDTSVNAIQGIANLAAVSGSSSQQASTAMYQLSQALAAGTVKLMDWNSVVNAGMGGQVFQDALKETARVHGVKIDQMIKKHGSFRETLQEGWITSDILTETLSHFTMAAEEGSAEWENFKKSLMDQGYSEKQATSILKLSNTATDAATKVKTATQLWDTLKETAQSGWTQTWEIILGDFGEAKELFSGIYETLSPMLEATAKARNTLLEGAMTSNWDKMVTKINEAGIETDKFEEKLKSTAESHGIDVDKLIKEHGSLEKAFRSGAISSDILKEAVKGLEGKLVDLSGITGKLKKGSKGDDVKKVQQALEKLGHSVGKAGIDGSFGKATQNAVKAFQKANGLKVTGIVDEKTIKALEKASGKADGLSKSVSGLIDDIDKLGGRELLIQSLKNIFDAVLSVVKPIKEAFRDIFPATTAEQLYSIIEGIQNFTKKLILSDAASKKLKTAFTGVFSVVDIGYTFIKKLIGGVVELIGNFSGLGGGILDTAASIGEWLSGLRDTVKETDIFGVAIDKVVGFLEKVIDKLKNFGGSVKSAFQAPGAQGFFNIMTKIWDVIVKIGSKVGEIFAPLGKAISDVFNNASLSDVLNDGIFAAVLVGIYKFVDNLNGPLGSLKDLFDGISGEDGIIGGIKDTLDSVRGCFEAYQNSLQAETIKKIAVAIAILAASIFVISSIDGDKLDHSLGAIGVLFAELIGAFAIFNKLNTNQKGLVKGVSAIIGLASAMLVLSVAVKIMSTLNLGEMCIALIGVFGGLTALVGALKAIPSDINVKTTRLISMSIALVILGKALEIMGRMSWDEIQHGLVALAGSLVVIAIAMKKMPNTMGLKTLGMVAFATAMVILGEALKKMSSMSWDSMAHGLVALASSMAVIAITMKMMPIDMASKSVGMIALAGALIILGAALKIMSTLSWAEIGRGLAAVGGTLALLAGGMFAMTLASGGIAALIAAAGALILITPVLMALGNLSWENIGKGLAALAGAFAVVGVAGILLTPLTPILVALAGAFALFGVATLGIGAGLLLIGAGITALSTALAVGTTAIIAGLTAIIMGIVDLIPSVLLGLGDGILAFCTVIKECTPAIVETIFVVLAEVCTSLVTYVPVIADALFELLIGALNVLAERMPELISAAFNVIGAFFTGIVDALRGMDTTSLIEGIVGVGLFAALIFALSALTPMIPGAMVAILGMGAIIAEMALVLAAVGALAQIPGLSWLIGEGGDLLQQIGTAIGQFVGGLIGGIAEGATSTLPQVGTNLSDFMTNLQPFITGMQGIDSSLLDNAATLAGAILALTAADLISGIASFFKGGTSLADFGKEIGAFGAAMKDYSAEVAGIDTEAITTSVNAGKSLVKMAKDIPSDGLFGTDGIDDFGKNLVKFGKKMKQYADEVVDIDSGSITASVSAAKGLVNVAKQIPDDGTFGTDGIDDFGKNIHSFAKSLKKYSDTIAEVSISSINNSATAVRSLINVINSMVGMDSSGVDTFKKAVNSLSKTNFDGVVKTFTTSTAKLTSAGKNMFNSIIEGIRSMKPKFVTTTRDMITASTTAIKSMGILFTVAGIETISKFINGVLRGKSRVSSAFGSALSAALTTINEYKQKFYSAGANLVIGFANGINANRYKAAAQAKAMASAAASAARKELDEHSPSRVGYGIGDFFGIGFVNAIGDNVKRAYSTSVKLARAAESGLKSAFDRVSSIISGEIDVNPTISPVIDLTNVRAGANAISGMFGLQPSVGVLANVGAVSSMMNQRGQNGGSDDIVSAIGRLEKSLANAGGTTNNIINGVTYDDGSAIGEAVGVIARAILMEGRV